MHDTIFHPLIAGRPAPLKNTFIACCPKTLVDLAPGTAGAPIGA
jgi:hypothetical protein